jgi:hypothetical protein
MRNFVEHFLDETHGSGYPDIPLTVTEQGDYLCVQTTNHPLYVYRLVGTEEHLHPSVARMEHNGNLYKLEWIEDEKW